jgi:hypothetical protein
LENILFKLTVDFSLPTCIWLFSKNGTGLHFQTTLFFTSKALCNS